MHPAGMNNITRLQSSLLLMVLILGLGQISGCATTTNSDHDSQTVDYDPLEPLNRKVHGFNKAIDKVALKPLAKAYKKVLPTPVRRGITNFFSNLTTPRSALNNFLQGKPGRGFNELGRFLFNSTLGLGGFFDIAGAGGMERYDENFAQTLSVWGVPDGPYIVLPLWGPNMASDAFALPFDYYSDIWTHYNNTSVRSKVWFVRLIDLRYRLLSADSVLDGSQDSYITIREAYMQNRTFRIYDGDPPGDEEYYDNEMFDEFFEEDAEEELEEE
jgi:phospholipid-binding lipoprotein MlaA